MEVVSLLKNIEVLEMLGDVVAQVSDVVFDSRKVTKGAMYVALKGVAVDGHSFVGQSVEQGASVVVCERFPQVVSKQVLYVKVKNTSEVLGQLASNFYENPSEKLELIGVTGTNGKTSVATLLFDVFQRLGYASVLISTVEYRIGNEIFPSTHTTPDVLTLNRILFDAVNKGCKYAFMEVSSHGIHQGRINGLKFKIAGFTNLTHDHLDYHSTFSEYLRVKKSFFDALSSDAVAISNADDKNGSVMLQNTKAKKVLYGVKTLANYHAKLLEVDFSGMLINFNGVECWVTLTGKFNVSNLLLVFAISSELGLETYQILQAISALKRVKGRFETLKSEKGIWFVLDYAHTPDALLNIMESINEIRTKNERFIVVFGCGGNRDKEKRPLMGDIATLKADMAIITSDNPRDEEVIQIIKEIEAGVRPENFGKYMVQPQRKDAIKTAIQIAKENDIVLIAGKGHETYQEIAGVKHHFDDREVLAELLVQMQK